MIEIWMKNHLIGDKNMAKPLLVLIYLLIGVSKIGPMLPCCVPNFGEPYPNVGLSDNVGLFLSWRDRIYVSTPIINDGFVKLKISLEV